MALYRTISQYFWTDSKIDDDFTPEDKYFYLYLLTNPHTNICGCYEVSSKQMERETGYNTDTITRLLERMEHAHNVIRYSKTTKEILILNWYKYNWNKSTKLIAAIKSVSENIKNNDFKEYVLDKIKIFYLDNIKDSNIVNSYQITDVSIGYGYPMDTVSENDTPKPAKRKTNAFVKPSLDEISEYINEKGYNVDAEYFYNYYETNGWICGRTPMKNWKTALANWNKREYNRQNSRKPSTDDTLRKMYEEAKRKDAEDEQRGNGQNIDPVQAVISDIYG